MANAGKDGMSVLIFESNGLCVLVAEIVAVDDVEAAGLGELERVDEGAPLLDDELSGLAVLLAVATGTSDVAALGTGLLGGGGAALTGGKLTVMLLE